MDRFTKTPFFLLLEKNSNKLSALQTEYNRFARSLVSFPKSTDADKIEYCNALIYTRIELDRLADAANENTVTYIRKAIAMTNAQIEQTREQMQIDAAVRLCPLAKHPAKPVKLKWTGTPTEFVELIYALHEAGRFGKTPLKELFITIGAAFGCNIKNYYRLFWDVKNRASDERTTFLNRLVKLLSDKLRRMDDGART